MVPTRTAAMEFVAMRIGSPRRYPAKNGCMSGEISPNRTYHSTKFTDGITLR